MAGGTAPPSWPAAVLVGRENELDQLRAFWHQAKVRGGCLVLSGDQGSGKTALLDALAEGVAEEGAAVLRCTGTEAEADVPFACLNMLLLPVQCDIEQLGDRHRQALEVALGLACGRASSRVTIARAVLALFARLSAGSPVLAVVDDVHWVDEPSSAVLGDLARHLAQLRVGLLAAGPPRVGPYLTSGTLPRLTLEPLTATSAGLLLDARAPNLLPRERQQVLRQAQGNPLALLELARTAMIRQATTGSGSDPPALSPRLRRMFGPGVESMPSATRRLLLMAALDTSDRRRGAATDLTPAALEPAEHAGLVQPWSSLEQRVVFTHPLVRVTVVELADDVERRAAHAALADAEAAAPDGDLRYRAWHLAQAAIEPSEEVAALLDQGARSLLCGGDAAGAVDLFLRAADLSPRRADRSRRLSEAAYVAANVTGGLRGMIPLLADARSDDPVGGRTLEAATAAAYVLMHGEGDVHTAHHLLVGAIETHQSLTGGLSPALVEALHSLLAVCVYGRSAELWPPLYAALARTTAELPLSLSLGVRTLGDPARASVDDVRRVRSAMALVERDRDLLELWRVAVSGLYVDQLEHARAGLWRVVEDGRAGGAITMAINSLGLLQVDAYVSGRWDDAEHIAQEGLGLCDVHGYRLASWSITYGQALVAAARGEYGTSASLTAAMTQWAEPRRVRLALAYARHIKVLEALGRGDFEEAFQQASLISEAGTLASHVPLALRTAMDLVEAAVRTGRHDEARAHVAVLRELGVAALSSRLGLLVGAAEALVAPVEAADDLFVRTLTAPDVDRWPFDLARVQLLHGEHLRRVRAVSLARIPLEAALETFEFLGAKPWAARAGSQLLATGPPREGARHRSVLTSRELDVASMAAAGLTNRQVGQRLGMSPRTVSAHLYRVYAKLAVGSRAALRDALREPADESGGPHPGAT
jgi:DNA-binding CsgD family transcriptional regulator